MSDTLPLISLRGAVLGYVNAPVLRDVELEIRPGD